MKALARRLRDHPEERDLALHNLAVVASRKRSDFKEVAEIIMGIHLLNFLEGGNSSGLSDGNDKHVLSKEKEPKKILHAHNCS